MYALSCSDINRPDINFGTAWVPTNIASGTAKQTRVVVEHGALLILVQLPQSTSDDAREDRRPSPSGVGDDTDGQALHSDTVQSVTG